MSENWTREDMVRTLGSERAADFAKEMSDVIHAMEDEIADLEEKLTAMTKVVERDHDERAEGFEGGIRAVVDMLNAIEGEYGPRTCAAYIARRFNLTEGRDDG